MDTLFEWTSGIVFSYRGYSIGKRPTLFLLSSYLGPHPSPPTSSVTTTVHAPVSLIVSLCIASTCRPGAPLIFVFVLNSEMWAKSVSLRAEKNANDALLIFVLVRSGDSVSENSFASKPKKYRQNLRTLLVGVRTWIIRQQKMWYSSSLLSLVYTLQMALSLKQLGQDRNGGNRFIDK